MEKLNITKDKFIAKKLADNWYNKIRNPKGDVIEKSNCFLRWLSKVENKLYDRKCNINKYKINKLKKLLHKSIQDELIFEKDLLIFENSVGYIDKDHWGDHFLNIEDLFKTTQYKYLKDYYNYAKPNKIAYKYWFEVIKTFNGDDVKVEIIDRDEVFKNVLYKERYELYKNSNEILKITKFL